MIFYKGTKDIQLQHTVVALGKFDGLHRGHQILLNKLHMYRQMGYQTVVFTFDFHPNSLFSGKKQPLIYTDDERRNIIEALGIDVLIEYPFTEDTAHMMPVDFIRDVLIKCVDAKVIVVGDDFHFGYKRQGDVALLKQYASQLGYCVDNCEKLCINDEEISSTMIRDFVRKGEIEMVNTLLGRTYTITGTVIQGKAKGRTVKMPTANIAPDPNKLLPLDGVYISTTFIAGEGRSYRSLTNIGLNPTVGENNARRVETFIFDYEGNLYEQQITVSLYKRERGEIKFENLSALREQVNKDQANAMSFFEANNL